MGVSGVRLDKSEIIKAIHKNKGVLQHAALDMGCDPSSIYLWMKNDAEVKSAVDEARSNADQERIDQNQVLKAKAYKAANRLLDKSDCTMTIFTLKTLCGFKEQSVDAQITIEHVEKPYRENSNPT